MEFLAEGLRRAVALFLSGDAEVYGIALLTLKIGLTATLMACALGIPVGFVLATRPRRWAPVAGAPRGPWRVKRASRSPPW